MVLRRHQARPRAIRRAEALVGKGLVDLSAFVTHRFPLEEVEQAVTLAAERPDECIGIIIETSRERD